eukprot:g43238.t1
MFPGLECISDKESLAKLLLEHRRLRGDLIEACKLMSGMDRVDIRSLFPSMEMSNTSGHRFKEIVDFAKQLPGFLDLTREDQIALLKTSTIEIMLLETSRRYDPEIQGITFLKDFSYNKEDFARAGLQLEFINPIFEFSKGMNDLHLDDAEYALLIAISLFSA